MRKIIKPGQLITVNRIVYRCRKRPTLSYWERCCECALGVECAESRLRFSCGAYCNFKRL